MFLLLFLSFSLKILGENKTRLGGGHPPCPSPIAESQVKHVGSVCSSVSHAHLSHMYTIPHSYTLIHTQTHTHFLDIKPNIYKRHLYECTA